jgi:capsular exopolysaccharide synthesis family protein
VDGIAARLLHVAEFERTQVVMVSSAAGGEGKTVLATQLAMSLARTGHKTLLVDFDLRRPAIEKVFKLALGPGVSEVLRGEAQVQEAIHETATANLSVMTAGAWNPRLLTILAGGITESLFASLRSQYEFIVVDGCPILPVADARFVSQHVDGVILAVLRDVSRAPKIRTACRILSALGVRMLGAVVADSAANGDYSDSRYYRGFRTMVVKASNENK